MTLVVGPLALPVPPLLLLLFVLATAWAVRRHAHPADAQAADAAVWWAVAAGLVAARAGHVMTHAMSYWASPWDLLDIRDGGFLAWPGVLVGCAVLFWRVKRSVRHSARGVWATAAVGLVCWWGVGSAWPWLQPAPGQHLQALAVQLLPLQALAPAGAPPPVLARPEAEPQTLQSLAQAAGGKPVVLNLWATWCGPCRAEMPLLARAQLAHPEVLFVLANQGEPDSVIQAYLAREGLQLESVWRDPASALGPAVGSSGLPTTVYFDAQGRRLGAHVGVLTESALRVIVRRVSPPGGPTYTL